MCFYCLQSWCRSATSENRLSIQSMIRTHTAIWSNHETVNKQNVWKSKRTCAKHLHINELVLTTKKLGDPHLAAIPAAPPQEQRLNSSPYSRQMRPDASRPQDLSYRQLWDASYGCWEPNSHLLQSSTHTITKPSLQPWKHRLLNNI